MDFNFFEPILYLSFKVQVSCPNSFIKIAKFDNSVYENKLNYLRNILHNPTFR